MHRKRTRIDYGVIGADPGRSSGGLAYVFPAKGLPQEVQTWKLAQMTPRDVWDVFAGRPTTTTIAVLELVHSMPGQGVSSSFKFGISYGELRMAIVAAGLRLIEVTPAKWQGRLRCRTKGDKNVTKAAAQELFPSVKVVHSIADALLLAEYGRRWGLEG